MAAVEVSTHKIMPTYKTRPCDDHNLYTNEIRNNQRYTHDNKINIMSQEYTINNKNQDNPIKTMTPNFVRGILESKQLDVNMNEAENISEVQKFYQGKNIFITGSTGFLGKVLVEKLLRSCPGVENLYLLVRQKKGKDIYTRLDEIFEDPLFSKLKEVCPKFRHKIVPIPGDCEAPGLGLTIHDRQVLTEKVNIIFHSAATVKFDEHLRAALVTNVRAPLHILRLARDMKGLDVLMHVSTAYSNSHLSTIEEVFYPSSVNLEKLQESIADLTDSEIDAILPDLLGPWPNTYTFTKALAEKVLKSNAGDVPVGIFRPAIVTSSNKEPLECWVDNLYGPTGIVVGGATGVLHTIMCDPTATADVVPVDFVVNCLTVAARQVHLQYKKRKALYKPWPQLAIDGLTYVGLGSASASIHTFVHQWLYCWPQHTPPAEPPIYNYVSSVENKITWGIFMDYNLKYIDNYPFTSAVWYTSLFLFTSVFMNKFCMIVLHLLPATVIDGLAICVGQKPKMLKVYRKIHKFSSVLSYFCTREFTFCNRRTRDLWSATSESDKKLFPFSMAELKWEAYFEHYLHGIRKYIFKETDDTLPQAKRKWKWLYYIHRVVKTIAISLGFYIMWSIVSLIF